MDSHNSLPYLCVEAKLKCEWYHIGYIELGLFYFFFSQVVTGISSK